MQQSPDADKIDNRANDRTSREEAVEAVKNTPLAGQGITEILDPGSPLDHGCGKVATQAGGTNRDSK